MTPNQFAADGYDCVYAIYQAWRLMRRTAGMHPDDMDV